MKPQLALHMYQELDKKNPKFIGKDDYMVFEKLDGWYGYLDLGDTIRSRNMREIPSMRVLSKQINDKLPDIKGRLIFEILVKDMPLFKDLNGYLNRSTGDYTAHQAYIVIHDFINDTHKPFVDRYVQAQALVNMIGISEVQIASVLEMHNDIARFKNLAKTIWRNGGEGIILKRVVAGYNAGKRNASLLKIKEELTLDLLVTGMEQGQGKYKGTLGSLIVREDNGTEHSVSGMTDAERDLWWSNPDSIIGMIVEIKAMKRLANGSLREPRFKAIRWDKSE